MRQASVSTVLLHHARAAAEAEADQRRDDKAKVEARAQADPEPRRLVTTAVTLARRARALVARTT